MAANGKKEMDNFVDDLLDVSSTGGPPLAPHSTQKGGGHANMGMHAQHLAHQMPMGQVPHQGAPHGGQGLASFPTAPIRAPMGAAVHGAPGGGLASFGGAGNGAPMIRVGSGGVVPSHMLSGVPSSGFSSVGGASRAPAMGGLAGMQGQMPTNAIKLQPTQLGARVVNNVPVPGPSGPRSVANVSIQSSMPPGGASMPQPVSAKAATAAMSKSVVATTGPASKKQLLSETGASRPRNADGTVKSEADDEDEELITKDEEDPSFEPSMYGKSRMTDEEMRRERSKDEDRKLVNTRVIKVKVDTLCAREGMRAQAKVADAIALGVQRRLEDALNIMVQNSRRRMDVEGDTAKASIVRSSNPRLYLKETERKRQEVREKRIADKLASESGTAALDPSALRRQEEETAETALSFAGGPRRRPNALAAQLAAQSKENATMDGLSNQPSQTAGQVAGLNVKDRHRRVTLNDALNFLRQDLHSKHSQLTLNTMAGLKLPEAFSPASHQMGAPTISHAGLGGNVTTRSAASAYASSSSGIPNPSVTTLSVNQPRPVPTNSLPPSTGLATRSTSRPSVAPTLSTSKK